MIEERIRVRMLERVDSLAEGEVVNLPSVLADKLMAQGKARAVEVGPQTKKVVAPAEVKIVVPEEKKKPSRKTR